MSTLADNFMELINESPSYLEARKLWAEANKHTCTYTRYIGFRKVIDYCNCGKEIEVEWTKLEPTSKT